MTQSIEMNPYSPPTSDPERPPDLATRYKFTPNILWFIPGCAVGFLFVVAIKDGVVSLGKSIGSEPLDSFVFLLCFGAIGLLVSFVWRMVRHRTNGDSQPNLFARFLGGMIMSFGGVGAVTILEANKILGPPSLGGWILVIGIFAVCSIPAVEFEALLGRYSCRRNERASETVPD